MLLITQFIATTLYVFRPPFHTEDYHSNFKLKDRYIIFTGFVSKRAPMDVVV